MVIAPQPAPRRRTPLVVLLAADGISQTGNMLTMLAVPWFVLETTGSAARTGLVASAVVVPGFIAGLFGGPLLDRLGSRRVAVAADLVGAIGVGGVPLLYHTVGLPFAVLLGLVLLGALLDIPGLSARRVVLPELSARAGVRLERTNAAYESTSYLSLLLGPPLAGLLIALLSPSQVMWIDAATFVVSAIAVAYAIPPAIKVAEPSGGYLSDLVAGLRFLRRDPVLWALALTLTAGNLLTGPLFNVLLPVYIDAEFGRASALGASFAAVGAGSLLGAVVFGWIGHRLSRRSAWLVGFMASPLAIWVLLLEPSLPLLIVVQAVIGVVTGGLNPLLVTIRHERIPLAMRGRVFGAFSAASVAAQPIGMVATGFAIEGIGFDATVLALAALAQLLGIALVFVPAVRRLNHPTPVAAS
jgi:MFS family permease